MQETIFDPLRKKEVALTPEERVRQWFIGVMSDVMGIPRHMMMSEAGFRYGDKQYRSDIIVWNRDATPLAVVECKRPETVLDASVLEQAIRYNMVLNVKYIIITNGLKTFAFQRSGAASFEMTATLPKWEEMFQKTGETKL